MNKKGYIKWLFHKTNDKLSEGQSNIEEEEYIFDGKTNKMDADLEKAYLDNDG